MIPLRIDELPRGELRRAPGAEQVTGVQIDSRRVELADLFVAVGRGREFVDDALARGAAATLVPEDAFAALATLGGAVRYRSSARLVGITGSTGKTSTKDILAALCRPHARTIAAEGGQNNELGLPLTLCRIEPESEVVIAEMGMRGLGQIAELCAIARPDVGIVSSIGPVHLELLGTVERVAEAKAELIAALPPRSTAVVPAETPVLDPFLRRGDLELVRFGPGGDVELERFDPPHLVADVCGTRVELEVPFRSRHQMQNTLAALGAYRALGLPLDRAGAGSAAIAFSPWRGEETELAGGGLLVNDAYNANPVSMRAALEYLVERAAGRRTIAVLGDMAELGADSPAFHTHVGRHAAELGVDVLVAVGPLARGYLGHGIALEQSVADAEEASDAVRELLRSGDVVLVKASRAVGLERVAEALVKVPVL